MHDILETYSRKCPTSPADSDIIPNKFTDLQSILDKGSKISMFAFTSQQSTAWFLRALGEQKIASNLVECQEHFKKWQSNRKKDSESFREHYLKQYTQPFAGCLIGDRKISLAILPNPTGRGPKGMTIELKKALYRDLLVNKM